MGKRLNSNEKKQAVFLLRSVEALLKSSSFNNITVQNNYGVIQVSREARDKDMTCAIGFTADLDNIEDDDNKVLPLKHHLR